MCGTSEGAVGPVAPALSGGELRDALAGVGLLTAPVRAALDMAESAHRGQGRADGAPYLEEHIYPIAREVGSWARRCGWSESEVERAVVVALLHDVLEDGPAASEQGIRTTFGEAVITDVRALTKAPKRAGESPDQVRAREDAYRAVVFAASPLAWAVKVFDRLNNLACLHKRDAPTRERYIAETYEFHLRLARGVDQGLAEAMEEALQRLRAMGGR